MAVLTSDIGGVGQFSLDEMGDLQEMTGTAGWQIFAQKYLEACMVKCGIQSLRADGEEHKMLRGQADSYLALATFAAQVASGREELRDAQAALDAKETQTDNP